LNKVAVGKKKIPATKRSLLPGILKDQIY